MGINKIFSLAVLVVALGLVLCFAVTGSLVKAEHHEAMKDTKAMDLPGPQLVTGAWMFIAAYKADPAVLKSLLPEGLEASPTGQVVINMYTVPTAEQTSAVDTIIGFPSIVSVAVSFPFSTVVVVYPSIAGIPTFLVKSLITGELL